jgi:hypothetical protein
LLEFIKMKPDRRSVVLPLRSEQFISDQEREVGFRAGILREGRFSVGLDPSIAHFKDVPK